MQQRRAGSCDRLSEKFINIDLFGRPFTLMLPNEHRYYKTLVGAVMTLVTVIVVVSYAVYKLQLLIDQVEVRVNLTTINNYFDEPDNSENGFGTKDGFSIAAGVFAKTGVNDYVPSVDSSYGQLDFQIVSHSSDD